MSFLVDMIARRQIRIGREYGDMTPADRERLACCSREVRDFATAIDRDDVAVIAEVKKASPSAGAIAPMCEASKQALHYQRGGAAAVSVLTEPETFRGSFTDLSDVSDAVDVPVFCKDFVVDPVQAFVARGHGADAILLMVSVLGASLAEYIDISSTLGLTPLVEVVSERELDLAVAAGARGIGVNSRDLHSLEVNPERAREIVQRAREADCLVVAASGVKERGDVEAASSAGACAVLVGELVMRSAFPEETVEELTGVARSAPVR